MDISQLISVSSLKDDKGLYDDIFLFVMRYNEKVTSHGLILGDENGVGELIVPFCEESLCRLFTVYFNYVSIASGFDYISLRLDIEFISLISTDKMSLTEKNRLYVMLFLLKKSMISDFTAFGEAVKGIICVASKMTSTEVFNECIAIYKQIFVNLERINNE